MGKTGDDREPLSESQAIENWNFEAERMLRSMLLDRQWGYAELSEALAPFGIKRSAGVINRRINRGNFSAGFFLACLSAMQVEVDLRPKKPKATPRGAAKEAK
jgi:hypothetical protein